MAYAPNRNRKGRERKRSFRREKGRSFCFKKFRTFRRISCSVPFQCSRESCDIAARLTETGESTIVLHYVLVYAGGCQSQPTFDWYQVVQQRFRVFLSVNAPPPIFSLHDVRDPMVLGHPSRARTRALPEWWNWRRTSHSVFIGLNRDISEFLGNHINETGNSGLRIAFTHYRSPDPHCSEMSRNKAFRIVRHFRDIRCQAFLLYRWQQSSAPKSKEVNPWIKISGTDKIRMGLRNNLLTGLLKRLLLNHTRNLWGMRDQLQSITIRRQARGSDAVSQHPPC
eukprot:284814918_6